MVSSSSSRTSLAWTRCPSAVFYTPRYNKQVTQHFNIFLNEIEGYTDKKGLETHTKIIKTNIFMDKEAKQSNQ